MNFNNFTIKSQEAVQEAVNLVQSRGQQAIEPVHIMQGVTDEFAIKYHLLPDTLVCVILACDERK
jgi:hypothetical protein